MNNYMKRLVSPKKTSSKIDRPETSPTKSKSKSYRRRIHRLVPPASETAAEVVHSTSTPSSTATSHKPSPRRIRRYMRTASGKTTEVNDINDEPSFSSVTEAQQESQMAEVGPSDSDERPRLSLPNDTNQKLGEQEVHDGFSNGDGSNRDIEEEEVFVEETPVTESGEECKSPLSTTQIPWDEERPQPESQASVGNSSIHSTISNVPASRSLLLEQENLRRELSEVQMDRDILQQQLLEAKNELGNARNSLRNHISDLEDQLRTVRQSERRQTEKQENSLLIEELDRLAELAREHEQAVVTETSHKPDGGEVNHEPSMPAIEQKQQHVGTLSFSDVNGSSHSSVNNKDMGNSDVSSLYKERIKQLEDALQQRTLQEQMLEKEVRQMKQLVQIESEKTKETQRRIQWFEQQGLLWTASFGEDTKNDGNASSSIVMLSPGKESSKTCGDTSSSTNSTSLRIVTDERTGDDDRDTTGASNVIRDSDSVECIDDHNRAREDDRDSCVGTADKKDVLAVPFTPMALNKQRLELEHRIQELLDEIGTLRLAQETSQHEKQHQRSLVQDLQNKLEHQHEQHRLENILLDRQLSEWKSRSESLETKLGDERTLVEKRNVRSLLERHEWSQRVEELETANNELKTSLEKNRISFDHQKGYLKRTVESLEKKIQETSVATDVDDKAPPTIAGEDDARIQPPPAKSDEEEILRTRIETLEAERDAFEKSERNLREQLKKATEESKEAKTQASMAEDRARVLQTFLNASMSASPKREKQLELEQEYFSVHARPAVDNGDESHTIDQDTTRVVVAEGKEQEFSADLKKTAESSESDDSGHNFNSMQGSYETSFDAPVPKLSTESQENIGRAFGMEQQAKTNNDVVQNLHLQLDEELEKLKRRKERRRERAVSSTPATSTRKYRTLLSPSLTPKFLQLDETESDQNGLKMTTVDDFTDAEVGEECLTGGLANNDFTLDIEKSLLSAQPDRLFYYNIDTKQKPGVMEGESPPQPGWRPPQGITEDHERILKPMLSEPLRYINDLEKEPIDDIFNTDLSGPSNYESVVLEENSMKQSFMDELFQLKNEKEKLESKLKNKVEDEEEAKRGFEAENRRLIQALETALRTKDELEQRFKDAVHQNESSRGEAERLSRELAGYRSSLEQYQTEKSDLIAQIELLKNKINDFEHTVAKQRSEETLGERVPDLVADVGFRDQDKIILSHDDQVIRLEQKILVLEAESKSNLDSILNERDSVTEERNLLELNLRDVNVQLNECKESETVLKTIVEETSMKLKSIQDECQNLSRAKERENLEYNLKLTEKDEFITDLEKDVHVKERRLEQASAQLSEMENDLLDREEEIEKLDAKRRDIQNNASTQLVEMEKLLEADGEEIDRLQSENLKLQESIKTYEQQIDQQAIRLAEASVQLSEMESELFAKDDDIAEIELKINAMQALESQRLEVSEDWDSERRNLKEQLDAANQNIQNLTSQIEDIKNKYDAEEAKVRHLEMDSERKDKELSSSKSQLNRQLQNVLKLTEQNDKWQLQLERSVDEKREVMGKLADAERQVISLQEQLDEATEMTIRLNAINVGLKDDLDCAAEEDEKNRRRISQMEEQREALSEELESAMDNLSDLKQHYKESQGNQEMVNCNIVQGI